MKLFIITLSCLVLAANAVTYVPTSPRLRRDVSELFPEPKSAYLPPPNQDLGAEMLPEEPMQRLAITEEPTTEVLPEETTQVPSAVPEIQDTAVFGDSGYEYKTVRKTVFRSRRDVSHLKLNYLPPFESQQPSNEYLPPVSNKISEEDQPSSEYLSPVEQEKSLEEDKIPIEAPQPSNEYLPPHSVKESEEISTEPPQPINEYLPPAKLEEVETVETASETEPASKSGEELIIDTEAPAVAEVTTVAPEEESTAEIVEAATEAIQEDTAIFAEDGYHYKQQSEVPADLFVIEAEPSPAPTAVTGEYLPPMEAELLEAEGPRDGESAVLAEDGYHYRVIKRRF